MRPARFRHTPEMCLRYLLHVPFQSHVVKGALMHSFLQSLQTQRWDDHRYYHHSRINQSLHLVSALSFLTAYVLMFTNPAAAGFVNMST